MWPATNNLFDGCPPVPSQFLLHQQLLQQREADANEANVDFQQSDDNVSSDRNDESSHSQTAEELDGDDDGDGASFDLSEINSMADVSLVGTQPSTLTPKVLGRFGESRQRQHSIDSNTVIESIVDNAAYDESESSAQEPTASASNNHTRGGLGTKLAALHGPCYTDVEQNDSTDFSAEAFQSEEFTYSTPSIRKQQKRTKPRKHKHTLEDMLARLPGGSAYQDKTADYTAVMGDDTATIIITRENCLSVCLSVVEPPLSSNSSVDANNTNAPNEMSLYALDNPSTVNDDDRFVNDGCSVEEVKDRTDDDERIEHLICPIDTDDVELSNDPESIALNAPPIPTTKPPHVHDPKQFSACVLSFLANPVSEEHATKVVKQSINLVQPIDGKVFLYDWNGTTMQQLPTWLRLQLRFERVDTDESREHLKETLSIMNSLGKPTEREGQTVFAWMGVVSQKIVLPPTPTLARFTLTMI
jgi:hypothetical protein